MALNNNKNVHVDHTRPSVIFDDQIDVLANKLPVHLFEVKENDPVPTNYRLIGTLATTSMDSEFVEMTFSPPNSPNIIPFPELESIPMSNHLETILRPHPDTVTAPIILAFALFESIRSFYASDNIYFYGNCNDDKTYVYLTDNRQ
jgi:hypothetical protein